MLSSLYQYIHPISCDSTCLINFCRHDTILRLHWWVVGSEPPHRHYTTLIESSCTSKWLEQSKNQTINILSVILLLAIPQIHQPWSSGYENSIHPDNNSIHPDDNSIHPEAASRNHGIEITVFRVLGFSCLLSMLIFVSYIIESYNEPKIENLGWTNYLKQTFTW